MCISAGGGLALLEFKLSVPALLWGKEKRRGRPGWAAGSAAVVLSEPLATISNWTCDF